MRNQWEAANDVLHQGFLGWSGDVSIIGLVVGLGVKQQVVSSLAAACCFAPNPTTSPTMGEASSDHLFRACTTQLTSLASLHRLHTTTSIANIKACKARHVHMPTMQNQVSFTGMQLSSCRQPTHLAKKDSTHFVKCMHSVTWSPTKNDMRASPQCL